MLRTVTYLELFSMTGRRNKTTFAYIRDMILKKINSWIWRCLKRVKKSW